MDLKKIVSQGTGTTTTEKALPGLILNIVQEAITSVNEPNAEEILKTIRELITTNVITHDEEHTGKLLAFLAKTSNKMGQFSAVAKAIFEALQNPNEESTSEVQKKLNESHAEPLKGQAFRLDQRTINDLYATHFPTTSSPAPARKPLPQKKSAPEVTTTDPGLLAALQ